MNDSTIDSQSHIYPVIVIGAGITGLGVSYYLGQAGIHHLLLEKTDALGGIWSTHRWPGIRCDSDMVKYSYSFKPFLSDKRLVNGEVILEYLHEVAEESGIERKIQFGVEVFRVEFDSSESLWLLHTSVGAFRARFIVNGNGYFLDKPFVPEFPHVDQFEGEVIHLFRLDQRDPKIYQGKRVLMIGSGASAISTAPDLSDAASSLVLLQRTPSYIYEKSNSLGIVQRTLQSWYSRGFKAPLVFLRGFMQFKDDFVFVLFRTIPLLGRTIFKLHWRDTVNRDTYARIFQAPYKPWQQRIPVAIGLKERVRDGRIRFMTGEIDAFTKHGAKLKDGNELEFDLCVLATGFTVEFFKFDIFVDGKQIDTADINYYKGMMMGGIPNFFQPLGTLHTAWTQRLELVSKLLIRIIRYMESKQLSSVVVDRKKVTKPLSLSPGYIMRHIDRVPKLYGSFELPSIDKYFFYWFRPGNYRFERNESQDTALPESKLLGASD